MNAYNSAYVALSVSKVHASISPPDVTKAAIWVHLVTPSMRHTAGS